MMRRILTMLLASTAIAVAFGLAATWPVSAQEPRQDDSIQRALVEAKYTIGDQLLALRQQSAIIQQLTKENAALKKAAEGCQ